MITRRHALTAGMAALATPGLIHKADAASPPPAATVQVLTYHRLETRENPPGTILSPAHFAAQMEWLDTHATPVLKLSDAQAIAAGTTKLQTHAVAITADDGWRTQYTELFPVILKHRMPLTIFLNPPMIGRGAAFMTWPMVQEMHASGLVSVQAHTQTHPNFNDERKRRTPTDFANFVHHELADCRAALEDKLGAKVDQLAWPFGIHSADLEAAAAEAGYTSAWALGSKPLIAGDPPFALPRSQIYETDDIARFAWMAQGHARKQLANTM